MPSSSGLSTASAPSGDMKIGILPSAISPEGRTPGDVVPVRLHARVTEAGTLELEAVPRSGEPRWKIELDVRGEREPGAVPA